MHDYNEEMKSYQFTAVALGDYIYVLTQKSMYRLRYCDSAAEWERVADLIEDHGLYPPAVAASGAIIVPGAAGWRITNVVTKYEPTLNQWRQLSDKIMSAGETTSVASPGYVYCIGGGIEDVGITNRVERLHVASESWTEIAPMISAKYKASAVEFNGNIIVAGARNLQDLNSVEKYNPEVNQWTAMQPMLKCRWVIGFRCHVIGGNIFAVGPDNKGIEIYEREKDVWSTIELPNTVDLDIWDSVKVQMTQ